MMKTTIGVVAILAFCFVWHAYATANCTATGPGRYVEPNDNTCKNYTLCVYITANNTYLAYNYVCPTTSLFNPNLARCTSNYTCTTNAG
ncbi:unnamed protein product [Spodoptera exigua]|uniref:Chitin-binding type-2 domain-containing protein n=1 Tax=Spodoptera exigua TaxID=7107 RepID=A0A835G920_SPOEX|nr:hypothetical protein HW555_011366 [Spodoptera exigua]KAH9641880.1 hypothetical protein HF086_011630 [Spodoptera exigua]CAH0669192.1 unnamed protein product [Spodoptera exigua]